MDIQSFGAYTGIISLVIHAGVGIFNIINHKRCRSGCCGRVSEISFDVDNTTPPLRLSGARNKHTEEDGLCRRLLPHSPGIAAINGGQKLSGTGVA